MVGGHEAPPDVARGVVRIGPCSGVLIRPDAVLTSAHCVERPVDHITLLGQALPVTACAKHPDYKPFEPEHDVGVCRLAAPAATPEIAVDEHAELTVGDAVRLAGYGQSEAIPRGGSEASLRVVETSVVGVAPGVFHVGTASQTACRGDSGGPVLAERDHALRVVGIIHGPAGAMCASPTEAARLDFNQAWVESALGGAPARGEGCAAVGEIALVLLAFAGGARWCVNHARRRSPHDRAH